ncbi:unnamed protein product, partial [Ectocarpus sp. 12 AP-2014]
GHSDDAAVNIERDGGVTESDMDANDVDESSVTWSSWDVNSWASSVSYRVPQLDPLTVAWVPHIAPLHLTPGLPTPADANDAALVKWTFHLGSSLFSAVIEHCLVSVFTLNNVAEDRH